MGPSIEDGNWNENNEPSGLVAGGRCRICASASLVAANQPVGIRKACGPTAHIKTSKE
jgi:hypothetical protein